MTKHPDEMTDAEAADFYYQHRNDPDLVGEEVEVVAPARLSRVVSVRFSPEEAEKVQQRAEAAGLTLSAYVRQAALDAPAAPRPPVRMSCANWPRSARPCSASKTSWVHERRCGPGAERL
ncbi:plasmid mobilization protein [Gandjariella thermophila]|uniref:Uncharacterized protein n=1 Tax=Gandjariella thermophila TaxID=1931992 RepID=A0A4D4J8J3_9PSEU|nr:hypothetical protein [Gandjariella thermophila]GDY30978.1 hypothetical protein GTS_26110 [Gandjariella thermophila]